MCAIIGVSDTAHAGPLAVEGLHMLQHRGREASGVATMDDLRPHWFGGVGLVGEVFPQNLHINEILPGKLAIGHNRYSTVTKADPRNAKLFQPVRGVYRGAPFFLVHNGNITNKNELDPLVPEERKTSSVDTELVVRLIEQETAGSFHRNLVATLHRLEGTYNFLILYRDELIAIRDRTSNRPLYVGKNAAGRVVFASETCAFGILQVRWDGLTVDPGTIVCTGNDGRWEVHRFEAERPKRCIFEEIYFKLPASHFDRRRSVREIRTNIGEEMERMFPVPNADIAVPVPDSAVPYGMGWGRSRRSGECVLADLRHHHAGGRTFILPTQEERGVAVRRKHILSQADIEGKVVVLIEDSIVRGTTLGYLVPFFKEMGAAEVHGRIAYDRVAKPCYYGVDTPTLEELIAPEKSDDEIAEELHLDSLKFFPIKNILRIAGGRRSSWCYACAPSGKYWHKEAA